MEPYLTDEEINNAISQLFLGEKINSPDGVSRAERAIANTATKKALKAMGEWLEVKCRVSAFLYNVTPEELEALKRGEMPE